jgi:hypothetical protein
MVIRAISLIGDLNAFTFSALNSIKLGIKKLELVKLIE